jgi:hypothetical protein
MEGVGLKRPKDPFFPEYLNVLQLLALSIVATHLLAFGIHGAG